MIRCVILTLSDKAISLPVTFINGIVELLIFYANSYLFIPNHLSKNLPWQILTRIVLEMVKYEMFDQSPANIQGFAYKIDSAFAFTRSPTHDPIKGRENTVRIQNISKKMRRLFLCPIESYERITHAHCSMLSATTMKIPAFFC